MKKFFILLTFFFIIKNSFYSQDCQDCLSRTIIQYDYILAMDTPQSSPDSIAAYCKIMNITMGLYYYFNGSESMKDCISYYGSPQKVDSSNFRTPSPILGTVPEGPIGQGDYHIDGNAGSDSEHIIVNTNLVTNDSREIIARSERIFDLNMDPMEMGAQIGADLGPVYEKMLEYEKKKRDEGEPYAIHPSAEMNAAKSELDFNEVTNVYITINDCDNVPLKNRKINLTVEGGTLDTKSVTTDDNGVAVVKFTAGTEPTIAEIEGTFNFKKPASVADRSTIVGPLGISIKKPADCWFVNANYSIYNNNNDETSGPAIGVIRDNSEEIDNIWFAAWVKGETVPRPSLFQNNPTPVQLNFYAKKTENTLGMSKYFNSEGGFIRQNYGNVVAVSKKGSIPNLDLNIKRNNYTFNITGINANQTGGYNYIEDDYSPPPVGNTHTEYTTDADSAANLRGIAEGFNGDTLYTTIENEPLTGTTKRDKIAQSFFWDHNVFKLRYWELYGESSYMDAGGVTIDNKSDLDRYVKIYMYYNPDNTDIPEENNKNIPHIFNLEQNFPNPFNPLTKITYWIPENSFVTLKVFDILGKEVATLIHKEQVKGTYTIDFNAESLSSGIYIYQLSAGNFLQNRKMVLLK